MVSEFVVAWVELNWLRDVAGSAFFVKRDARQVCAACHRGFVGGWLLGCPPAESGDRQHTPGGLAFQGGRVVCFEMLRCRIVLEFLDGFCVIFSMACGIVDVSYKIFLSVWTFPELWILKRFPFLLLCIL